MRSLVGSARNGFMSGKRIVIKVLFEDCEVEGETIGDATKEAEGSFSIQLPEVLEFDIDACEEALLKANYPTLRDALKAHVERILKKKLKRWRQRYWQLALTEVKFANEM